MKFNYRKYFASIRPKTKMEIYNRFIFAFTSVHTTWNANVKGYNLLKDKYWTNEEELRKVIFGSGLGLHNTRTKGIYTFTKDYMSNWNEFKRQKNEVWNDYAERLTKRIYGLGYAKIRFSLEMIYPNTAQVICPDTHIIQLHKRDPNKMNKRLYNRIQFGFIQRAKKKGIAPVQFRWQFWDNKQGYKDSRYWSYVLENDNTRLKYNNILKQDY